MTNSLPLHKGGQKKNMEKIITIDCDDVLSETVNALLKYYNYNIHWKKITRKDLTSHDFDKIKKYHFSFEERFQKDLDFFLNHDSLSLIKPVQWTKEKLLEFKKKWYKLYVITWRPDELKKHTFDWLSLHYSGIFEDVFFTNADKKNAILKSEICKKLWSEFMVEDDLRFARDIASKWIKVYLIDKPWNKDYDKSIDKWIIKIKDWSEVNV